MLLMFYMFLCCMGVVQEVQGMQKVQKRARKIIEFASDENGDTALIRAVRDGRLELARVYLLQGANVNAHNKQLRTALHEAAQGRNESLIELLIKHSADVNAVDSEHTSALIFAARKGYLPTIERLVKAGADIHCTTIYGENAVLAAAKGGSIAVLECFLKEKLSIESSDNAGDTPLINAARQGDKEMLSFLIKREVEVNKKNNQGRTALHEAASNGHIKVINLLLDNGASRDLQDADGCTAFMRAVQENSFEGAYTLIKRGAQFDSEDKYKKTCFSYVKPNSLIELLLTSLQKFQDKDFLKMALLIKNYKLFLRLIALGERSDKITNKEIIELFAVTREDSRCKLIDACKTLGISLETLETAARVKGRNDLMWFFKDAAPVKIIPYLSPLRVAYWKMVCTLAQTLAKNTEGYASFLRAIIRDKNLCSIENYIRESHVQDSLGNTPLMLAALMGNYKLVEALLQVGTAVNVCNWRGFTALMYATAEGYNEIVALLLERGADPGVRNNDGETALTYALGFGQGCEMLKCLNESTYEPTIVIDNIPYGNNRRIKHSTKKYLLHFFQMGEKYSPDLFDYLADPEMYTTQHFQAMAHAEKHSLERESTACTVEYCNPELAKELYNDNYGAKKSARSMTILSWACKFGHTHILHRFLAGDESVLHTPIPFMKLHRDTFLDYAFLSGKASIIYMVINNLQEQSSERMELKNKAKEYATQLNNIKLLHALENMDTHHK